MVKTIFVLFVFGLLVLSLASFTSAKITRVDIIEYKGGHTVVKAPVKADQVENQCVPVMNGVMSALPFSYVINPSNTQNLSEKEIVRATSRAAKTWNSAVKGNAFADYSINVTPYYPIYDYQNTISFSDIFLDTTVVGQNSLFFLDDGNSTRLVEFDMLLNNKIPFGDANKNASVIDLQALITHELGHSLGFLDLYNTECSLATMYGYSNFGDISKRNLQKYEISALKFLYN